MYYLPIFEIFINVKTQMFFQAKTQAKMFLLNRTIGPPVLPGRAAPLVERRGGRPRRRQRAGGRRRRARVRRVRRGARVRVPSDAAAAEQARAGRVGGLGSAGRVHVQEEL